MILKDRFLTQSAPAICRKLQKQAFGPTQSLEKLLQLAQTVYYGREYKGENKRQKRTNHPQLGPEDPLPVSKGTKECPQVPLELGSGPGT